MAYLNFGYKSPDAPGNKPSYMMSDVFGLLLSP